MGLLKVKDGRANRLLFSNKHMVTVGLDIIYFKPSGGCCNICGFIALCVTSGHAVLTVLYTDMCNVSVTYHKSFAKLHANSELS